MMETADVDRIIKEGFALLEKRVLNGFKENWILEDVQGKTELNVVFYYHLVLLYVLLIYLYTYRSTGHTEEDLEVDMELTHTRECIACQGIDIDKFISKLNIPVFLPDSTVNYDLDTIQEFVNEPDSCICYINQEFIVPPGTRFLVTTTSRDSILANGRKIIT